MITKFNISKPEEYLKNGEKKTMWNNVGTLTEFTNQDGSVSKIIEIPAIGLKARAFPLNKPTIDTKPKVEVDPFEGDILNPEQIPF